MMLCGARIIGSIRFIPPAAGTCRRDLSSWHEKGRPRRPPLILVAIQSDQSRSSSLMPVLERVCASTRFTITAQ